jgi:hypothetical protein
MDLNQRTLAARQFLMNQVKKSPLVQAVKQKSFKPYKAALNNTLQPMSLLPMGKIKSSKFLDPKRLKMGVMDFENDMAQHKAMRHFDSAQATANRIKKAAKQKFQQSFNMAHKGQKSAENLLASYIFRNIK